MTDIKIDKKELEHFSTEELEQMLLDKCVEIEDGMRRCQLIKDKLRLLEDEVR